MKVSVEVSKEHNPPYAVIYTDNVTDEIHKAIDILRMEERPFIIQSANRIEVISPDEIYMIRIESGSTIIYTEKAQYSSKKRLYEIYEQLGSGFMQISKQTIVKLSYIKSVEAGFNGTFLLKLSNGNADYVSRKYLSELKKYLGL